MKWKPTETIDPPEGGTVHVWSAIYGDWSDRLPVLEPILDAAEIERADRFLRRDDRDRHVFAHGILRRILGRCCRCSPEDLAFDFGPQGKPRLTGPGTLAEAWEFNLSHSGDMILVAVAQGFPVGVDVERCGRTVEIESLSRRFFSAEEADGIASVPAVERRRAFFDTWVCKEAFIKAVGEGLTLPLDSFAISLEGRTTRVKRVEGRPNNHLDHPWFLERFEVAEDYVGALTARVARAEWFGFALK